MPRRDSRPKFHGSSSRGVPQRPDRRSGPTRVAESRGALPPSRPQRLDKAESGAESEETEDEQFSPAVTEGEEHSESGAPGMRLQKFLAISGVDSRRNCEQYIRDGRVTVDGEVVTDPARLVDAEVHDIRLDSERKRLPRLRYFLLNKPKGVLCTNSDPEGRPRAVDLIPSGDQRLFTVGRLDENTQGLLLLTNDGDLAQRLAHPRFEVVRRYRCQVAGQPTPETLQQLREGMYFAEGFFRFRQIRFVRHQGRSTVLELELQEGKNREIRRLLARVGHKVLALERIAFGPLLLGSLPYGRFRELSPQEVRSLRHFLDGGQQDEHRGGGSFGYRPGKTRGRRPKRTSRSPAARSGAAAATKSSARQGAQKSPSGGKGRRGEARRGNAVSGGSRSASRSGPGSSSGAVRKRGPR